MSKKTLIPGPGIASGTLAGPNNKKRVAGLAQKPSNLQNAKAGAVATWPPGGMRYVIMQNSGKSMSTHGAGSHVFTCTELCLPK